ncbi:uncharacterized protein METZ01_LOCUS341347 [marine metagenome]|uniref:Uncharacterized protein n=1 Tax=marine metagenome TaxID=408172 RepID=A0A382QSP3_9ZZZZ
MQLEPLLKKPVPERLILRKLTNNSLPIIFTLDTSLILTFSSEPVAKCGSVIFFYGKFPIPR